MTNSGQTCTQKLSNSMYEKDLIVEFFASFSQMEAIWKASPGLFDWGARRPRLLPIGIQLHGRGFKIDAAMAASEFTKYLHSQPPKRQTGPDQWEDYTAPAAFVGPGSEIAVHLDKVRLVRNNLFHGGKWSSLYKSPGRDVKLIRGALDSLNAILLGHTDWLRMFEGK